MPNRPTAALSCLLLYCLLVSGPVMAAGKELVGVNPDIPRRICNASNTYISLDKSYKLRIPDIGKKIYLEDRPLPAEGASHFSLTDMTKGYLFIVSSQVKREWPSESVVLDKLNKRMLEATAPYKEFFKSGFGKNRFGRTLEYEFVNVANSNPIPYPLAFTVPADATPDLVQRIAVHRQFIVNGRLYEFAALMQKKKYLSSVPKKELLALANSWLDKAIAGFTPGAFESCDQAGR